jgi:hypothetical protein
MGAKRKEKNTFNIRSLCQVIQQKLRSIILAHAAEDSMDL